MFQIDDLIEPCAQQIMLAAISRSAGRMGHAPCRSEKANHTARVGSMCKELWLAEPISGKYGYLERMKRSKKLASTS